MIAVEGQYYFQCSAGDKKDFIDTENMVFFEIVEACGVMLPYYKLIFRTTDESIISKLHEGQPLNVQFGKSVDSFDDMTLSSIKVFAERDGAERQKVTVSGFMAKNNFLSQPKIKITGKVSGIEAVKAVVAVGFKPKFNIEKSDDSMNWVQYNMTDRNFVFDTLMHTYRKNSFVASAICINNDFRVKDMKLELKTKVNNPDWLIANSSTDPKAIAFSPKYQVQSQHGYMNSLATYGHDINIFTPETGVASSNVQKPEIIMALAKDISKKADVERRYFGSQMQNKNVHDNFWRAYQQNVVSLLSASTVRLFIPLAEKYVPIRPLDIAMFRDSSTSDNRQSNEYYSGVYFVSLVRRAIMDMKCVQSIEISREAFNGIKNAN